MFTAALFIVAKTWKQSKWPSADEWLSNILLCVCVCVCIYIYTHIHIRSDQISSVAQSCPTLCDPMNRSTLGLPVLHQLPESTQTHVH